MIKDYTEIVLDHPFDIVLTHGGYVGRDHYQTAKAGVGAVPAVKEGGVIIIAADNRDTIEPIGSPEYKSLIHLFKLQGPEGYLNLIRDPHWQFTKDQWEPEVWGRVLRKVGKDGLIYCSLGIPREDYWLLPGVCGLDFLDGRRGKPTPEKARKMIQEAVFFAVGRYREKGLSLPWPSSGKVPMRYPPWSRSDFRFRNADFGLIKPTIPRSSVRNRRYSSKVAPVLAD